MKSTKQESVNSNINTSTQKCYVTALNINQTSSDVAIEIAKEIADSITDQGLNSVGESTLDPSFGISPGVTEQEFTEAIKAAVDINGVDIDDIDAAEVTTYEISVSVKVVRHKKVSIKKTIVTEFSDI